MLERRIIDPGTTKRLLSRPYRYVSGFLGELREEIERHAEEGKVPNWVEATRELDRVLA